MIKFLLNRLNKDVWRPAKTKFKFSFFFLFPLFLLSLFCLSLAFTSDLQDGGYSGGMSSSYRGSSNNNNNKYSNLTTSSTYLTPHITTRTNYSSQLVRSKSPHAKYRSNMSASTGRKGKKMSWFFCLIFPQFCFHESPLFFNDFYITANEKLRVLPDKCGYQKLL